MLYNRKCLLRIEDTSIIAMDRRVLSLFVLVSLASGCKREPEIPYTSWIENAPMPESTSVKTAFEGYSKAARDAEALAGNLAERISISPTLRAKLETKLEPAVNELRNASKRKTLGFRFVPSSPSDPPVQARGWALLGRSLTYRISNNAKVGNLDKAIDDTLVATKFGFDLLAGSAIEASLGMTIVDDARRALTPYLNKLGAGQLGKLNEGMAEILAGKPSITVTLENERLNMRVGVQRIQDAYRDRDFSAIRAEIGPDIEKAIAHLNNDVRPNGDAARLKYFKGFAEEVDKITRFWIDEVALPADKRHRNEKGDPQLPLTKERPWRRFARHLTATCEPLIKQYDSTLARTRLFTLEAALAKAVKVQGYAPQDLSKFNAYATDPFNGHTFAYRRDGKSYRVYSVGADFQDDGGQTDASFSHPDLTIEVGI